MIPEDGWWDGGHLDSSGATAFGRWLTARIAATPLATADAGGLSVGHHES